MALSTIITRLEDALEGMAGVVTVKIPAPERPLTAAELPAIVSEPVTFEIDLLPQQSVWRYPITLTYLHAERGTNVETQLDAIWDKPKALVDVLNSAATLNGAVYGVRFDQPAGEIGPLEWRDKTYIGFTVHLQLKEKYAVTYTG